MIGLSLVALLLIELYHFISFIMHHFCEAQEDFLIPLIFIPAKNYRIKVKGGPGSKI